jgi:hypothetical protein
MKFSSGTEIALGVRIRKITLRHHSRWGSCTSSGELTFSWRLIMAPPFVLDYLAAHEVAQLQHMNHSPERESKAGSMALRACQNPSVGGELPQDMKAIRVISADGGRSSSAHFHHFWRNADAAVHALTNPGETELWRAIEDGRMRATLGSRCPWFNEAFKLA